MSMGVGSLEREKPALGNGMTVAWTRCAEADEASPKLLKVASAASSRLRLPA